MQIRTTDTKRIRTKNTQGGLEQGPWGRRTAVCRLGCVSVSARHVSLMHSPVEGQLSHFSLAIVNNVTINPGVQISLPLLLLGVHPEVEFWDHILIFLSKCYEVFH